MKAMILAAGRGMRMGDLTANTPKPLLKVKGKALIVHQIEKLVQAGIDDLVINHAYLGKQIEQALGDGRKFGATIRYSPEPEGGLETGGGIFNALPLLGNAPFLVLNADIYYTGDYAEQAQYRLTQAEQLGHLWLVDNPEHNVQGDFYLHAGTLSLQMGQAMTFSGISVLSPELFAQAKAGVFRLAPLFKEAISKQQLSASVLAGRWLDVGTKARLEQAQTW